MLQLLQAKCWRATVCHKHLHPLPIRVHQPLLPPLPYDLLLSFLFFFYLFLLLCLQLLLHMVDLPQQVVDEDGAPQVSLRVLQEPKLLQGQLQDAAPLLLYYQVLQMRRTRFCSSLVQEPIHGDKENNSRNFTCTFTFVVI